MISRASAQGTCFVYGTLMSSDVVMVLLGRELEGQKARLRDFSCHPVSKRVYPGIIQSEGKEVDGLLLQGLNKRDVKILDYFEDEGVDYSRQQVSVEVEVIGIDFKSTSIASHAFVWNCGGDTLDLGARWNYEEFVRQHLARYLERVVKPCRAEVDELFK